MWIPDRSVLPSVVITIAVSQLYRRSPLLPLIPVAPSYEPASCVFGISNLQRICRPASRRHCVCDTSTQLFIAALPRKKSVTLVFGEWLDKEAPLYFVVGASLQLGHNSQQHHLKTKLGLYILELTKTVKSVRCNEEFCLSPSP